MMVVLCTVFRGIRDCGEKVGESFTGNRPLTSVSSSRDPSPASHLLLSPKAPPHLPVFLLLPPSLELSVSLSRSRLVTAMGGKRRKHGLFPSSSAEGTDSPSLATVGGGNAFPPLFPAFLPPKKTFSKQCMTTVVS